MRLYLRGHAYSYAVQEMLFTLFPGQKAEYPAGGPDGGSPALLLSLDERDGELVASATLWWEGRVYTGERRADLSELTGGLVDDRVKQRVLRMAFYDAGVKARGDQPPWGALTGVRPVKLPTRRMAAGASRAEAKAVLTGLYRVGEGRAELAMECAETALSIRDRLPRDGLSLYVGIPFCPSRCAYCSFISADVKGALGMVEPYVDLLCREIQEAGRQMRENGLYVSTAYMGGGTPTTLNAEQMDRVLSAMEEHLPMERCGEFTVEAGRPDTITGSKLEILKTHGIKRISINPQSMEDSVLAAMGRAHTAAQIEGAMSLAGERFGGLVNMDLIAGLPTDTVEGFSRTLDRVLGMAPANITVHTLALKKGSRLTEEGGGLCAPEEVAAMLELAEGRLRGAGYRPYYLYRQKYMSGSFENVGWCLPGTECAYNVIMMEELQTVLSLGAGGVTKLVDPDTGYIKRITNPKYPHEYLRAWDKLAAAKREAAQFQAALAKQA